MNRRPFSSLPVCPVTPSTAGSETFGKSFVVQFSVCFPIELNLKRRRLRDILDRRFFRFQAGKPAREGGSGKGAFAIGKKTCYDKEKEPEARHEIYRQFSYKLGAADCFCEMVRGVKKIALAHPCDSREERDGFLPEFRKLCRNTA